jgi:hypothetical protein
MRQLSLLETLLQNRVAFVLVGGMAAVAHGSSQLTRDLDICVPLSGDNFLLIQTSLQGFNPRLRAGKDRIPLDLDSESAGRLKNLYILSDEGNLDCLGEVAGIGDYAAALAASVAIDVRGHSCRVLSLDALIRAKEAMGRPRDLLTVLELRAIQEKKSRLQ